MLIARGQQSGRGWDTPAELAAAAAAAAIPCSTGCQQRHSAQPSSACLLQVRAFVQNAKGDGKQEVNQSPLTFVESTLEPALGEALKRKDAIIRVRNAQISALWDELHTRQPWRNAITGDGLVSFSEAPSNSTRKLAVLGINTVSFWSSRGRKL